MTNTAITSTPTPASDIVRWETKAGKARLAASPSAVSRAPAKVRNADADSKTLTQLKNGTYGPFLMDVRNILTKRQLARLEIEVRRALIHKDDQGREFIPVGDVLGRSDKVVATAFATYVSDPVALVKDKATNNEILAPDPLKKSGAWIGEVAAAWLQWIKEQDAEREARIKAEQEALMRESGLPEPATELLETI